MTLRVALLHHDLASPPRGGVERMVLDVAAGLRERGHEPVVLSSHQAPSQHALEDGVAVLRVARLPEGPLHRRGFTGPLTHLPLTRRALNRGDFDVAHAFSAPAAAAALCWNRATGRPVVFTCAEPIDRSRLADRRLRLRLLSAAIEDSEAVIAADAEVSETLWRWMSTEAQVIEPADGLGHEKLYRRLLG